MSGSEIVLGLSSHHFSCTVYNRALHPEATVSGQASEINSYRILYHHVHWNEKGGEKDGFAGLSGSHTNCFKPREDKKETAEEINGQDPLILFSSNFLSWSLQACSKYASYRASQHEGCSLGFQKTELWNSAALEKKEASFCFFLLTKEMHSHTSFHLTKNCRALFLVIKNPSKLFFVFLRTRVELIKSVMVRI